MPRKKLIRRHVTEEVLYLLMHKTQSPNVPFESSVFRFVPEVAFVLLAKTSYQRGVRRLPQD